MLLLMFLLGWWIEEMNWIHDGGDDDGYGYDDGCVVMMVLQWLIFVHHAGFGKRTLLRVEAAL